MNKFSMHVLSQQRRGAGENPRPLLLNGEVRILFLQAYSALAARNSSY